MCTVSTYLCTVFWILKKKQAKNSKDVLFKKHLASLSTSRKNLPILTMSSLELEWF